MDYGSFLSAKSQQGRACGFDPVFMPSWMFDAIEEAQAEAAPE